MCWRWGGLWREWVVESRFGGVEWCVVVVVIVGFFLVFVVV